LETSDDNLSLDDDLINKLGISENENDDIQNNNMGNDEEILINNSNNSSNQYLNDKIIININSTLDSIKIKVPNNNIYDENYGSNSNENSVINEEKEEETSNNDQATTYDESKYIENEILLPEENNALYMKKHNNKSPRFKIKSDKYGIHNDEETSIILNETSLNNSYYELETEKIDNKEIHTESIPKTTTRPRILNELTISEITTTEPLHLRTNQHNNIGINSKPNRNNSLLYKLDNNKNSKVIIIFLSLYFIYKIIYN